MVAGGAYSAANLVIRLLRFETPEEEAQGIANNIAQNRGRELGQTVVLARIRRLLKPVKAGLSVHGINADIIVRRDELRVLHSDGCMAHFA